MSSFDETTLLEHHDFLRRLARGLVLDDAAADDLAQETWLQALRVPPRHGDAPRSWLATIARNLARNARRGDVRRRDREAQVAIAEGAPVDERADRGLELQAEVAQALDRLAEPYRTALFLRYFEDRSPAAIATELGVPLETVRSRLKRGLARLRDDLDARHQGQRSAWSLPLAAFAEPRSKLAATGLTSMSTWSGGWIVMSILTVCGVVTLSTLAWLGGERDVETSVGGGREGESALASVTETSGEVSPPTAAGELAPTLELQGPGTNRTSKSEAVVRGRLLLPDGAPATGVTVKLEAYPQEPQGAGPRARIEEVRSCEAQTTSSGAFELRIELDGGYRASVVQHSERFVSNGWRGVDLGPGVSLDLDALTLLRSGSVRVVLVDGADAPLDATGWSVSLSSDVQIPGQSRPGFSMSQGFGAGASEVTLTRVAPASTVVKLTHPLLRDELLAQVVVVADEQAEVTVRYDGPSPSTCLVVELRTREFGVTPDTSHVRLLRDAETALASDRYGPVGPFYFSGLAPGAYEVECTDPNFRPFRAICKTGEEHRFDVVGAASLEVLVVDEASGADLALTALELAPALRRFASGMMTQPRPFEVELDPDAASVLIENLLPGEYGYTLTTAEYGEKRGRIDALLAGVTTKLRVEVGEETGASDGLVGVVVTVGDGAPVGDVLVQVTRGERAGHDLGPNTHMMDKQGPVPSIHAKTRTDEAGRFTFADLDPGQWTLRVNQGPWFQVDRTLTRTASDVEPVRLAIPRGSLVRGVVQLPEGVAPQTIGIQAALEGDEGFGPAMGPFGVERVQLAEDATFAIGPFPPGVWTLRFGLCGPSSPGPQPGMEFPGSWVEFHEENVRVAGSEAAPARYDLSRLVPAPLTLVLGEAGVGPTEVSTWIWSEADPTARVKGSSGMNLSVEVGRTGNEPMDLGAYAPGSYRLALIAKNGRWATVLPETLRFQVATPHVAEATITLEPGTLELLDAKTGEPLADVDAAWEVGLPEKGFRRRRIKPWQTDGEGRCDLRIPNGAYELTVEGYAPATIEWPPASGGSLVVRLTPAK